MEIEHNLLKFRKLFRASLTNQSLKLSNAPKRLFDVLASSLGLLVLSPFFVVFGILIKRDSPGPIFFRGLRMGKREQPFHILKFRTMTESSESYEGPRITGKGDYRVTPIGKWLRSTKINELPQLWNVLKGEMSLVGPRPEDFEIASNWPESVRQEILSVRPGITNPTSIAYRREEKLLEDDNMMDKYLHHIAPDKFRLDRLYVRHHSFLTDLDAIFWTLLLLIPAFEKYTIPEGTLFQGPFSRFVRRHLSWFVIDFFVSLSTIGFMGILWRLIGPMHVGFLQALIMSMLLSLLFSTFNTILGLKKVDWHKAVAYDAMLLLLSGLMVLLIYTVAYFVFPYFDLMPLRFVASAGVIAIFTFIVVRYRLRLVTGLVSRWVKQRDSGFGAEERVLVVGSGQGGDFINWILKRPDFIRRYKLVGSVDDDPRKQGMRFGGIEVLGTVGDISEVVRNKDIGLIIYSIGNASFEDEQRIMDTCRNTGIPIVRLASILRGMQIQLTTPNAAYCDHTCPFMERKNESVLAE